MKKFFMIFAVCALLFSLTACDDETKTTESGEIVSITTSSENKEKESKEKVEAEVKVEPTKVEETVTITGRDPKRYADVAQNPVVTIEMKDGENIKVELYPQYAPSAVENFISLINNKFYDNVIFHRVIPGFMAQGGDPLGTGTGGPGYYIEGEFKENNFLQNTLKHDVGTISMARATPPNSAGSQFFIVTDESAHDSLDGKYAAFGKVIEGMEEVYKIVNTPVNYSSNALNDIYMKLIGGQELDNNESALILAYQAGEQFDLPIEPQVIKTMTVDTFGVEYQEPFKIQE